MRSLSPLLAASAALLASGCQQKTNAVPESNLPQTDLSPTPTAVKLPTVDAPLTRRDLLLATFEAASAIALGTDDRDQQRALAGKTFSLRIRWCAGDTAFKQQFDLIRRVLKVSLVPDIDRSSAVLAGIGADADEATGFWLPRPWMLAAGCPIVSRQALQSTEGADSRALSLNSPVSWKAQSAKPSPNEANSTQASQAQSRFPARLVGIIEWIRADDPRIGPNHRRSYAITRRVSDEEQPGPVELVIEGRLSPLPNSKVIQCEVTDPNQPPACLLSVSMDRVRLEGSDGKLLAEWSSS